jgi:hypothetical protein
MSDQLISHVLELPPALLALLYQHVASGPGGLANPVALSQTCKVLHTLYEGPAVAYSNIILAAPISSPDHPVWQWLAKRSGRIANLVLTLRLRDDRERWIEDGAWKLGRCMLLEWVQPLQTLSCIPGVELRLEWVRSVHEMYNPLMNKWLKQYGQIISHLTAEVHIDTVWLPLWAFSKAAAACKSINLTIGTYSREVVNLSDLDAVASSLRSLRCDTNDCDVRGASTLSSMSQLTALHLKCRKFQNEEPWDYLAMLPRLQQLKLAMCTSGDPSPLSALTGLSVLHLYSRAWLVEDDQVIFNLSSLQPLSTLQHLEELHLKSPCAATSLQGLAGLSNLKRLSLGFLGLRSLEGISPRVTDLEVAHGLTGLAGIECCSGLEKLSLRWCRVSTLQPLRGLSSLRHLEIAWTYELSSLKGLSKMSLQSLSCIGCFGLTHLSANKHLPALTSLELRDCPHISMKPLSQLREGLRKLRLVSCNSHGKVLRLPHVQPLADVVVRDCGVKAVVLAGGFRPACIDIKGESSEDTDYEYQSTWL